jgi:transcription elongation factor SPT6
MEPLRGDKLFQLLTGENDWTLRCGKEVTGKVVKNTDFGSRIRLEGDIPGFIALRNMADERVEAAEDVLSEGSVVTAVVVEVKKEHISVDLSLRMEDFRKSSASWERPKTLPPLDEFFDVAAAELLESARSKERESHLNAIQAVIQSKKMTNLSGKSIESAEMSVKRSGLVTRRACAHPAFRNANNAEVNDELNSGGAASVGEALLRPSSKFSDTLALHWVVRPGVIKIIEVIEENKDTEASIGNILKIKNEEYGSIDELLGRYIAPLNDRVEEISHHRKFVSLSESEVDEKLKVLKKKSPSGVFYFLCWSEKYPGYASLRYIIQNTPREHPIAIAPDGFLWGSKTHKHLDSLLNDFKINPSGQVGGESASKKPNAPTVVNVAKPSRWGARPAPPPFPPPPPPPAIGWGASAAAPPATGWGVRST